MVPVLGTQLTIMGESMDYYSLALGVALMAYCLGDVRTIKDGIGLMGWWYAVPLVSTLVCAALLIFNVFSAYFGAF